MILGSKTRIRAMLAIWVYDMAKFLVLYKAMQGYGINPWIFFFLDMVTVPTYVMGWSRLMGSITGEIQAFRAIFTWSLITFVSSTTPYFYAAFAGLRTFPPEIWWFLALILLFSLINLIRKIRRANKTFAQ
jgi:ABC-type microcin C transport system permease subunit YejE